MNVPRFRRRVATLSLSCTSSQADSLTRCVLRSGNVRAEHWPEHSGRAALDQLRRLASDAIEMASAIPGRRVPDAAVLIDWPTTWSQESVDDARRRVCESLPWLEDIAEG